MKEVWEHTAVDPNICHGKPCIKAIQQHFRTAQDEGRILVTHNWDSLASSPIPLHPMQVS